jgi:O-antigen ligase
MVRDYPFSGIGFNTFEEVYNNRGRDYEYKPPQAHEITSHAHYLFLNIAAEMGIPALLAFLWLVIILTKEAWSSFRESRDPYLKSLVLGLLGGLWAYLLFEGGGIMIRNNLLILFWGTFGLLGAIRKITFRASQKCRP